MHPINRAYGEDFDFVPHGSNTKIKQYLIAAIPRAGTTLLSHLLWKTGCLGAPLEYVNPSLAAGCLKRLGCMEIDVTYWRKIKSLRTSPNGIFGWKAFLSNYVEIAIHHRELLAELTPDRVIYITRRDKILQAVSYSMAISTGIWHAGVPYRKDCAYDKSKIDEAAKSLIEQERAWERIFEYANARVMRLCYEDLIIDPERHVADVAKFIGVQIEPQDVIREIYIPTVQRNDQSLRYALSYYNELLSIDAEESRTPSSGSF